MLEQKDGRVFVLKHDGKVHGSELLTDRTLVQTLLDQNRSEVVDVQTVAHAGAGLLHGNSNTAVAVIITGRSVVEDAKRDELGRAARRELDNFIAVLCFSAVTIVHGSS